MPLAPKSQRSQMETRIIDQDEVSSWKVPPFQRPLRVNDKVRAVSEKLKCDGGCIEGILTLGKVNGDRTVWIVDGQHRIEAFKISHLKECIADVRLVHYDTVEDMSEAFVNLNSQLVRMRPDDLLRAAEGRSEAMTLIRAACPFVGYEQVRRRDTKGPVLSMSAVIRCWYGSSGETPNQKLLGSVSQAALDMAQSDARACAEFLVVAYEAWGGDPEYFRMWGILNLCMCMWMWRQYVTVENIPRSRRATTITKDDFKRCLMSLSASSNYLDWLAGRLLGDRDRSPCYSHIRRIFSARLQEIHPNTKGIKFLQPAWYSQNSGRA